MRGIRVGCASRGEATSTRLDVTNDDDVDWLSRLVWRAESDRERRLVAAIATARRCPSAVYRGDLGTDLPDLASQALPGAHLVIYPCAVLYQVAPEQRERFAARSAT